MRITFCFIVFIVSLITLLVYASEEEIFRDELHSDTEVPDVTLEEYKRDLEKLLLPHRAWDLDLRYIIFPLAAIALTVIVIFFIKQIQLNIIRNIDADESEIIVDEVQTEKAALSRADAAIEANDFRGAIRYLYLSAVFHLQENGILPYDKSMTNREYLQKTEMDDNLQTALTPTITVFDEVWYGYKPCDEDTVSSYRELIKNVYTKQHFDNEDTIFFN